MLHILYMADYIPQVAFHKPKQEEIEFEVLNLRHLFSRNVKLAHPLDQPHRVEFYQILFITRGEGRHYIDFTPYEFSRGSLLFVSAGQVHAFDVNPRNDGFLLLFTENFLTRNMVHSDSLALSRLWNYHLSPPVIPPDETCSSDFASITRELYDEYVSTETFAREEILRNLLNILLLKAERIKRTLAPAEKNTEWILLFNRFRHLLAENFVDTRNADSYAALMNISYNHLNRIVKSITGNTAKSFIDAFVTLEIKRQLAVTDIPIKELTYLAGFDEPTNFVKYFKKHTLQSPVQFRKNLQK